MSAEWKPPEVIGLCPECHDEFYVPHGGKCPAEHEGEAPDLITYVKEPNQAKTHKGGRPGESDRGGDR